ncbi:MAG: gliding motility-associated C-terminal domain-containing protein [Saprospiraceae bacterium]|nr:gliding motility-associated C-terminal domain-containing protein [Saprospiraceae bacterium]MBK9221965.1 gliding motility-associated C-terminal domain-containing protein [Saprospiraceae bacterium]
MGFKLHHVLLFLACIFSYSALATHIIGGELYYECLGYGNNGLDTTKRKYLITIKLYRDCGAPTPFDANLGFTIYRQNGNQYVNTKTGNGSNAEYRIPFTIPVENIDPPVYPCLQLPPNICGEAGTYEMIVELPIINQNYLIVWQRCCRNGTITNIVDPGATGATYSMEIHPEAQRTCNSSPRFINFPPIVLCVNAPFKFDHSALDKEGDLLIYEFCEPLKGGGQGNGGGPNANCNNPTPTPDCLPPYSPVAYRFPYTALFPLGGNPPVTINSLNGIITGKPDVIGQFVVSVCVYEYRNGILLSVLKRDFQFNVASCEGNIEARLVGASKLTPDHFEITVCGTNEYQILNASVDFKFINEIMWTYENGGAIDTFFGWAPYIKFKEGGVHNGQFIINPGTNCGDTGYFKINVIPDLKSQFTVVYDSCKAGPVQFTDHSSSAYSNISSWSWSLGDGITSFSQNPNVNYIHPGTYPVLLTIKDNFGCVNTVFNELKWYPAPDVIVFRPNVSEGCVPLNVEFKNVSFPTDNSYRFLWKFSDGAIDSGFTIDHTFTDTGVFDLKLEVTSPLGCYNEGTFNNVIYVYNPPIADWEIDKSIVNIKDPIVQLKDLSAGTIGRTWIIDGKQYFFNSALQYEFNDTGMHHIQMIVTDRFLCTDTLEADITVYRDFSLFMPNAFTPNGDGKNDVFVAKGQIHSLEKFQLQIFDRWGGRIFSSSDPDIGWNGKFQNSDKDAPPGIYVYDLYYKVVRKEAFHERNMLSLIK